MTAPFNNFPIATISYSSLAGSLAGNNTWSGANVFINVVINGTLTLDGDLLSTGVGDPIIFTAGGGGGIMGKIQPSGAVNANWVVMLASIAGQPAAVQVDGSDTNIDLKLVPKGTGSAISPAPIVSSSFIGSGTFTVATLPAGAGTGSRAMVSDSTVTMTAGIGAIVAGGGGNTVPVYKDPANWRIG